MKAAEYLAGIDAGTTGATVMLVDLEGQPGGNCHNRCGSASNSLHRYIQSAGNLCLRGCGR